MPGLQQTLSSRELHALHPRRSGSGAAPRVITPESDVSARARAAKNSHRGFRVVPNYLDIGRRLLTARKHQRNHAALAGLASDACHQNKGGPIDLARESFRRPPGACDVGICLAQSTAAGEGGPGYQVRTDGTGGGVPVAQTSQLLDAMIFYLDVEISAAINIIVSLEEHRQALVARMAASPHISVGDIAGKTPAEIDKFARGKGLIAKGPNPKAGQGAYVDPATGNQRVLVHPEGASPHAHVNNSAGQRLGPGDTVVEPESPEAHLPIKL